jgi:putative membrane protein
MGEWHADVLLGLGALAALYAWATRRAGESPVSARSLAMLGALMVLAWTLNGPLHDLSDHFLFSAHMVQHLTLTLVVPPLLLSSLTPGRIAPLLSIPGAASVLRRLTRAPVAFALYNSVLVIWHLPGPYGAALEWHPLHVLQHLSLIATAVLAWCPILSPTPDLPRPAYPAQMLYLFLLGIPMTVIAALVTLADVPLYAFYAAAPRVANLSPLEDQRLGGLIMWIPGAIVPLIAFTAVFFRWAAAERDDQP